MALLSGQLDSVPLMAEEDVKTAPNGDVFGIDQVGGLPLGVDYRSPVSHFVPPAVELMQRQRHELASSAESSSPSTPVKRKRGRPRVDKTSPEYLATVAARKQAREMASGNLSSSPQPSSGEKRKRGRPRVDKTSPEYLARKRAREMEALERKAKREYRRRTGEGDSPSGENRVKRKYTKRAANDASGSDRVKGKRGRPRKVDQLPTDHPQHAKIRVRSNLMPSSSEPITLDSDDDNDLGSPRDSISFDENLRALRHIREKYANIDKDDLYEAHLLAANCKKPETRERNERETSMTAQDLHSVEKLEDSDSDSDSSTSSGSSSSSSGSSSSSNSSSSGSSDTAPAHNNVHHDGSLGAWSSKQDSESDSDPERKLDPKDLPPRSLQDEISESENESPDKSFQCHICHKWYSTRVTLKIHRRSHQTRAVEGRSRRNDRKTTDDGSNDDSRHRRDRDERRGRCSDCHNTYHSPDALRRHRVQAHGAGAGGGHACSVCGKRFTHAHSLTRHMHNHAKQLYRCVVCKASFARADQLAQHLNSHLANYKRLKP